MRRCRTLKVLIVLFVCLCSTSWAEASLKSQIIGKWVGSDGNEKIEFMKDGTVIVVQRSMSVAGDYRFIDDKRIRVDLKGLLGSKVFEFSVNSKTGELSLIEANGEASKYLRETEFLRRAEVARKEAAAAKRSHAEAERRRLEAEQKAEEKSAERLRELENIIQRKEIIKDKMGKINNLLARGLDLNAPPPRHSLSAFWLAAASEDARLMEFLLAKGMQVNSSQCNALIAGSHIMSPNGREMVDILLGKGLDVSCTQSFPFVFFVTAGIDTPDWKAGEAINALEMMQKWKINIKAANHEGKTLLEYLSGSKKEVRAKADSLTEYLQAGSDAARKVVADAARKAAAEEREAFEEKQRENSDDNFITGASYVPSMNLIFPERKLKGSLRVAFSPDGKFVAVDDGQRNTNIVDVATGTLFKTLEGRGLSLAFSPDGKMLATWGAKTAILWDIETWTKIKTLAAGNSNNIYHWPYLTFSSDGKFFVIGESTKTEIWDVETWKTLRRLENAGQALSHTAGEPFISFLPDGNTLATGGENYSIIFWDLTTGAELKRLRAVSYLWADFSPDGQTIASSSIGSGVVVLRDAVTGNMLNTLDGSYFGVAFSPDGKVLATGSVEKGKVILWEVATGKKLKTLEGHSSHVRAVAFSPDGKRLASVDEQNNMTLWDTNGLYLSLSNFTGNTLQLKGERDRKLREIYKSKDEFETQTEYEERIRIAKIEEVSLRQEYVERIREARHRSESEMKERRTKLYPVTLVAKLGKYDADRKGFDADLLGSTVFISISREKAIEISKRKENVIVQGLVKYVNSEKAELVNAFLIDNDADDKFAFGRHIDLSPEQKTQNTQRDRNEFAGVPIKSKPDEQLLSSPSKDEQLLSSPSKVYRLKKELDIRKNPKVFTAEYVANDIKENTLVEYLGKDFIWVKIRLSDGKEGWVGRDDVEVVKKSQQEILLVERLKGTWKGDAIIPGDQPIPLEIIIRNNDGASCGSVTYPATKNDGKLECLDTDGDTLILLEQAEYGKSYITAVFHMKNIGDNKLECIIYTKTGKQVGTAKLIRQH